MIKKERLEQLQRDAELGILTAGGDRGISGKEVIELINAYRGREVAGSVSGDAFLGAMVGGFVGRLLEKRAPQCKATRGGRRCTSPLGHDTPHRWGPLAIKAKKL
jgi:hypothetical protein